MTNKSRKLAMAIHMGIVDLTQDHELIQSFKGQVIKCEVGEAKGRKALTQKRASAMRMGFYKNTRYGC